MLPEGFEIRPIVDKEDYSECEKIQMSISPLNEVGIVPAYLMEITTRHGGISLGLYDHGKLVGFSYAFPAYTKKNGYYLFSDTMGLYPPYQKRSLGFAMKQEQCRIAIEKGVRKMVWTFDPLLGQNANLNFRKLGGIVTRYDLEKYNEVSLNLGIVIPADRFYLQWQIHTDRVKRRLFDLEIPRMRYRKQLNFLKSTKTLLQKKTISTYGIQKEVSFRELLDIDLSITHNSLVVEIPFDYKQIRNDFPLIAQDWRLKTRLVFDHYINQKAYRVYEFFQLIEADEVRNFYLLHAPMNAENESLPLLPLDNQMVK
jgi:predicted GNAT superfamily acetyltransferase